MARKQTAVAGNEIIGNAEAESKVSAAAMLGGKAMEAAIRKNAANDAIAFLNTSGSIKQLETRRLHSVLERAEQLRNKNAAPNSDEDKGPLGLSPQGLFYVAQFRSALLAHFKIEKANSTVRTATSEVATLLAIVNLGGPCKIETETKGEDGKIVKAIEQVDPLEYFKAGKAGGWSSSVRMAREFRNQHGKKYQSSRGGNTGSKALTALALAKQLGKWNRRMTADTIIRLTQWAIAQGQTIILPDNKAFYATHSADWLDALTRSMTEVQAPAKAADNVKALGLPKGTDKAEAEAAKVKSARASRKAA